MQGENGELRIEFGLDGILGSMRTFARSLACRTVWWWKNETHCSDVDIDEESTVNEEEDPLVWRKVEELDAPGFTMYM